MDLERAAIAAMQGLLVNRNDEGYDVLAEMAMDYALALKAKFDTHAKAEFDASYEVGTENGYNTLKERIPTDDRLWQASTNPETPDAE